jgi:hypothetical protein
MHTVTASRHEAKYLASHALLNAGFSHEQVGRAMLALEIDPEPPTELEIEPYEPTEADLREYELYLERLEMERGCDAWTICPIR